MLIDYLFYHDDVDIDDDNDDAFLVTTHHFETSQQSGSNKHVQQDHPGKCRVKNTFKHILTRHTVLIDKYIHIHLSSKNQILCGKRFPFISVSFCSFQKEPCQMLTRSDSLS